MCRVQGTDVHVVPAKHAVHSAGRTQKFSDGPPFFDGSGGIGDGWFGCLDSCSDRQVHMSLRALSVPESTVLERSELSFDVCQIIVLTDFSLGGCNAAPQVCRECCGFL